MKIKNVKIELDDGEIITCKKYIASDGKELYNQSDCINYEKKLESIEKIKQIPFKTVSIMQFESWYYISSMADFQLLKDYIQIVIQKGTRTDFDVYACKDRFVNDWISYTIEYEENGNSDYCSFKSFKEIQKDFMKLEEDFRKLEKNLKEI